MFITFEGGEGSGKSTQAKLIAEHLIKSGKKVVLTREPGGTELAEKIRNLLLGSSEINDPMTELLLLTAARKNHIQNLIMPALNDGKIVISDRFLDSTLVYQGYVKKLEIQKIMTISKAAFDEFMPDITFLIDIDPQVGKDRIAKNRNETNHYDKKNLEFHESIRKAYLEIANLNSKRIKVIDGSLTLEQVTKNILSQLPA
jgi:dTMP kinase